jgi:hypothetical protein
MGAPLLKPFYAGDQVSVLGLDHQIKMVQRQTHFQPFHVPLASFVSMEPFWQTASLHPEIGKGMNRRKNFPFPKHSSATVL